MKVINNISLVDIAAGLVRVGGGGGNPKHPSPTTKTSTTGGVIR